MRTYSFYVGSTDTHDAHTDNSALRTRFTQVIADATPALTHCVWNGVTENVAIYRVALASDVQARRLAFALAVITGNDAVLVVRDTDRDDYARTFDSTAPYRAHVQGRLTGNRIMYPSADAHAPAYGYAYIPSPLGMHVACLVGPLGG